MIPVVIHRATERAEAALRAAGGFEAFVARRDRGEPPPDEAAGAPAIAAVIAAAQGRDGSWRGRLTDTADALVRLHELRAPGTHETARRGTDREPGADETVLRGLAWIRRRFGAEGAFGSGCDPDAHEAGLCHHFLPPFPAPNRRELARIAEGLASDGYPPSVTDARLDAACRAFKALFRWGWTGSDSFLYADCLERIASLWQPGETGLSPAAHLAVLHALLDAPDTPARRAFLAGRLEAVARTQRGDGTFTGAEPFRALAVLLAATRRGFDQPAVLAAIRRGANLLAVSQKNDGTWGDEAGPHRTLIGWRALRHAAADLESTATANG